MEIDPSPSIVEDTKSSAQGALRRSSRTRQDPILYGFIVTNDGDVKLIDDEPTSYKDATLSEDSHKWHDAMKSEIQSMYDNQVWN